ncbi:actin-like [Sipha flava]|uniref:Actin-like n=1 Tax=Sipha flava TaxID=143950 RepID=A0A8B8FM94_9HEMI|nr:actin-like [Sipha flava]
MGKVGLAKQERPYTVFPTKELAFDQEGSFVADDVKAMRDFLDLKYTVERGIVNNWDDMDKILKYTIEKQLKANLIHVYPIQHPILITESPSYHRANREKMTEENNNIKKELVDNVDDDEDYS